MSDSMEAFDAMLGRLAVPSLATGAHEETLLGALIDAAHRRRHGQHVAPSWVKRLAYAAGILIPLSIGACWAHRYHVFFFPEWSKPFKTEHPTTAAGASTRSATMQASGTLIGVGGVDMTEGQAGHEVDAVRAAIDRGDFELKETRTAPDGTPIYIYLVRLADGRQVRHGTDRPLIKDPVQRAKLDRELEQAMRECKGRVISQKPSEFGEMTYIYLVTLSDGSSASYGSNLEPDAVQRQKHQRELEKAMSQRRGEVVKTIPAPNGTMTYIIKVTLSDGTVKTYGSPEKPTLSSR